MFVEYSWNIPMIYPRNIRKSLPMNFREIFTNNVLGILKIGIFPECSMNILRLLHAFFRWIMELSTSAPQQAGDFIMKYYFGISNITACR